MTEYLAQVLGAGTEADPYRPAIADHVDTYGGDTVTPYTVGGLPAWRCTCTPTMQQAAAIAADSRIEDAQ